MPSQKGVKLGLYRGSELSDPDRLLEGAGKIHRHVRILAGDQPRPAAIARLPERRARGLEATPGLTGRREPARPVPS